MATLFERVYGSLPEHYRETDEREGFPLQRWLQGALAEADNIDAVVDRVSRLGVDEGGDPGETSDLVNPATADPAWLPWLGSLLGVRVNQSLPVPARRDQVAGAVNGFKVGSRGALAAAVREQLTGGRFVQVYAHSIVQPGDGGRWDVMLVTRVEETPVTSEELAERVAAMGAKPAGVVLHHRMFTASWDAIDTAFPTWGDLEGLTWAQIDEAGLT